MKLSSLITTAAQAAAAEGQAIEQDDPALLAELLGLPTPDATTAQVATVAALQQQVAALQAEARRASAAAFATRQVTARRALPAERAALEQLYLQAAEDDAARPLAASRVAALTAAVEARPAHVLTAEHIGDAPLLALAQQAAPVDPVARKRALLALTPLGRSVLAAQKGA